MNLRYIMDNGRNEMRLLYGTQNKSKLETMRKVLKDFDLEIVGLQDVGIDFEVFESGRTPLENARIKAIAYFKVSRFPTFSCDSGLYIDGLEEDRQPGVFVRRVNGLYLDDDAFIKYYSDVAKSLGGEVRAKF